MRRGAVLLIWSGSQGLWDRTAYSRAWRIGSAQGQGQSCLEALWAACLGH